MLERFVDGLGGQSGESKLQSEAKKQKNHFVEFGAASPAPLYCITRCLFRNLNSVNSQTFCWVIVRDGNTILYGIYKYGLTRETFASQENLIWRYNSRKIIIMTFPKLLLIFLNALIPYDMDHIENQTF